VIATKVGTHPLRPNDYTREAVLWSVEQSRKALQTDVIDVILVHDIPDIDLVVQQGGGLEALEELKSRGVVRAIGLAVQNHAFMRSAINSDRFDVIQSPYDYNLVRSTAEPLIGLANRSQLGFINASPFNQGLVSGVDPTDIVQIRRVTNMWAPRHGDVARATAIWHWAQTSNVDIRAMAIQYCLRKPRISTTLLGPRTPNELEQDLESAFASLEPDSWQALEQAASGWPAPSPGGEAATGAYAPDT
jgi:aryl-alcohol dehydrogenase-like predicted oxidoreductase